jgi:hypothetical protein
MYLYNSEQKYYSAVTFAATYHRLRMHIKSNQAQMTLKCD